MAEPEIKVVKHTAWIPVALDDDGTPLAHGERMIETEPGIWKAPDLVALEEYMAAHPVENLTEEDFIAGAVAITEASMAGRRQDEAD